jgi:hypothetical protein
VNEKQRDNLRRVLAHIAGTPGERVAAVQFERGRLAKMLREARVRVKANKAAHEGVYVA